MEGKSMDLLQNNVAEPRKSWSWYVAPVERLRNAEKSRHRSAAACAFTRPSQLASMIGCCNAIGDDYIITFRLAHHQPTDSLLPINLSSVCFLQGTLPRVVTIGTRTGCGQL